jgi:hypothetical protein
MRPRDSDVHMDSLNHDRLPRSSLFQKASEKPSGPPCSQQEAAERLDALVLRLLKTPPEPRAKLVKRRRKSTQNGVKR